MPKKKTTAISTSQVIAMYVLTRNMLLKGHISKAVYVHDISVWVYVSYELTAISKMTRSTGVHTFHIIGICPWTNISPTLHIHVPLLSYHSLHIDPTLSHTQVKNQQAKPLFTIIAICTSNKYSQQMSHICHMCKSPYVHHWGSMPIYMPHITSLTSTMWSGTLCTDYSNGNNADDKNATHLHMLS